METTLNMKTSSNIDVASATSTTTSSFHHNFNKEAENEI